MELVVQHGVSQRAGNAQSARNIREHRITHFYPPPPPGPLYPSAWRCNAETNRILVSVRCSYPAVGIITPEFVARRKKLTANVCNLKLCVCPIHEMYL